MIEGWSVVSKQAAMGAAGQNAEVVHGDGVTFAHVADALIVIVDAGDRPRGNAVDNANTLVLREPLPSEVNRWIRSISKANQPFLGFVEMTDGCLALGNLNQASCLYRGLNPFMGEDGTLTFAELTWAERLPSELLDKVRPTPMLSLPGIDWLDDVPRDLSRAAGSFLTAWYADVPVPRASRPRAPMNLPAPLLDFYEVVASRRELLGRQDFISPLGLIEYVEDEPLVAFAFENQGVWSALIDPTDDDPIVWYDGGPQRIRERERLSGFLLQFALKEAVSTSPFTGFATVTTEVLDRFVEDLVPVPLQPMRVPGDPTRHWVAPGLVVMAADNGRSGIWLSVGSRQRCALRPLRARLDWEQFNG